MNTLSQNTEPREQVPSDSPRASMARSNGEDADEPQTKRRRLSSSNSIPIKTTNTRRKTACQACRLRKIKCDAVRPTCGICKASDAMCKYTDPLPEKLTYGSLSM